MPSRCPSLFAIRAHKIIQVRILKAVTPAFGKLSAVEAKLEGDYRAGMGRLGREGEEIAWVIVLSNRYSEFETTSIVFTMEVLEKGIF